MFTIKFPVISWQNHAKQEVVWRCGPNHHDASIGTDIASFFLRMCVLRHETSNMQSAKLADAISPELWRRSIAESYRGHGEMGSGQHPVNKMIYYTALIDRFHLNCNRYAIFWSFRNPFQQQWWLRRFQASSNTPSVDDLSMDICKHTDDDVVMLSIHWILWQVGKI